MRRDLWLTLAIFVAAFWYLRAFPDALSLGDESILLLGAKRWLSGEALYRDFFEFLTPGSFALYATAFRLGGLDVAVARTLAVLVNALSASLAYQLGRQVAGRPEAVLVALLFVVGCVPAWNVASPHWISTALALATAVTLLSERWRAAPVRRALLAGFLAGLAFANQQQRGTSLLLGLAAATWLLETQAARDEGRSPRRLVLLLWTGGGALAPVLGFLIWVLARGATLSQVRAATVDFVFFGYGAKLAGTMPWGGAMPGSDAALRRTLRWLPTLLPVVTGAEAAILAVRRRRGPWNRAETVRACLVVWASVAAASILYFPDYVHVAFIGVFALALAAGQAFRVRAALESRAPRTARVAFAGIFLWFAGVEISRGAGTLAAARAAAPAVRATRFGSVAMPAGQARALEILEHAWDGRSDGRRALLCYPMGAAWNLLLDADNPTPFAFFVRGYNSPAQEQQLAVALARRPETLVLTTLPEDPKASVWKLLGMVYQERLPAIGRYRLFSRVGQPYRGTLEASSEPASSPRP